MILSKWLSITPSYFFRILDQKIIIIMKYLSKVRIFIFNYLKIYTGIIFRIFISLKITISPPCLNLGVVEILQWGLYQFDWKNVIESNQKIIFKVQKRNKLSDHSTFYSIFLVYWSFLKIFLFIDIKIVKNH